MDEPVITFAMPPVEDFVGAVALVRAAGAHGDGGRRQFVIDGPTMTISEVAALLELVNFPWDGPGRLSIDVVPQPSIPDEFYDEADGWWQESQRRL